VASEDVVTDGTGLTVIVRDSVLDTPAESVTTIVKVPLVALAPTVPAMVPVEEFRLRPEGREPEDMLQVSGPAPPEATGVCE
jgi:hypothetical protein